MVRMEIQGQLVILVITIIKRVHMVQWVILGCKDILDSLARKDMLEVQVLRGTLAHKE